MATFDFDVPSYAAGMLLCDALGKYDAFQFENNIKPDYCNMGGVVWNHPVLTEGEWWDLDIDEAEEFGFVDDGALAPHTDGPATGSEP